MSGAEVLDLGRDAIWITVLVAAGPMIVGLAVGLVVSLLQTLTQIQEQTLVFVPKILAIFFAILLFLPIMGGLLVATLLTLLFVPALYAAWYRVRR